MAKLDSHNRCSDHVKELDGNSWCFLDHQDKSQSWKLKSSKTNKMIHWRNMQKLESPGSFQTLNGKSNKGFKVNSDTEKKWLSINKVEISKFSISCISIKWLSVWDGYPLNWHPTVYVCPVRHPRTQDTFQPKKYFSLFLLFTYVLKVTGFILKTNT